MQSSGQTQHIDDTLPRLLSDAGARPVPTPPLARDDVHEILIKAWPGHRGSEIVRHNF
jgi:hypothetical protein